MQGVGIGLVILGLLSFALPLVGVQFRLINLLGLAWGQPVAAMIFLALGVFLVLLGWLDRSNREARSKAQMAEQASAREKAMRIAQEDEIRHQALAGRLGRCPNCESVIPLASRECPKCHASFDTGSAWKLTPL